MKTEFERPEKPVKPKPCLPLDSVAAAKFAVKSRGSLPRRRTQSLV
jgi:hypothetical protein